MTEEKSNRPPALPLFGSESDVFRQLFFDGPTWDGNLVSKTGRDNLVMLGLAVRHEGWQTLSVLGFMTAMQHGFGEKKEAYNNQRRQKKNIKTVANILGDARNSAIEMERAWRTKEVEMISTRQEQLLQSANAARLEALKKLVKAAWENAVANGADDTLRAMTHDNIARDMIDYDSDIAMMADGDPDDGEIDYDALQEEIVAMLPEIMGVTP